MSAKKCSATIVIGDEEFECLQEDGHTVENGEESRHASYERFKNRGKGKESTWLTIEWD